MKDTNNLLTYNVWSGTEYANNIDGFVNTDLKIKGTNQFSSIGESSLQIIKDGPNNWCNIDITSLITSNGNYTFKCNIYSNSEGYVCLRQGSNLFNIYFDKSKSIQTIIGSINFIQNINTYIQLVNDGNGEIYFDNLQFIKS